MKNKLTFHYSLLHFCYQIVSICIIGYSSYYLLECGLKNAEIGILVAVTNMIAVFVLPMIGTYADKPKSPSLKKIMMLLFAAYLLATLSLYFLNGKVLWLVCILFGFSTMMFQILLPCLNSLGTESINQGHHISLGFARGTGSLSYAIVSYILGIVVIPFGISVIPVFASCALAVILIALHLFPFEKNMKSEENNSTENQDTVLAFFRKYKSFVMVLAGCICFYMNHTLLNNFLFQIVQSKGGTTAQMGISTAIAAMLEFPVMFGFSHLLKKISAGKWIFISGIFYTLKALGSLIVPSMIGFYFVQILQMFSWATITVSAVYYVNDVMKEEDKIKGQSYMGTTFTLGTIIGSVMGGFLLDYTSVNMMLIVAAIVSGAGVFLVYKGLEK